MQEADTEGISGLRFSPEMAERQEIVISSSIAKIERGRVHTEGDFLITDGARLGVYIDLPMATRLGRRVEGGVGEVCQQLGMKKAITPMAWEILERGGIGETAWLSGYMTGLLNLAGKNSKPYVLAVSIAEVNGGVAEAASGMVADWIKGECEAGKLPYELVNLAVGIRKYVPEASEDPIVRRMGDKFSWADQGDKRADYKQAKFRSWDWKKASVIETIGQSLVCREGEKSSQVQVITGENDGTFRLTKNAWNILLTPPSGFRGPIRRADGEMVRAARITSETETMREITLRNIDWSEGSLAAAQAKIKKAVEEEVAAGRMEKDVLDTVSGVIKYKHATLESDGVTDRGITRGFWQISRLKTDQKTSMEEIVKYANRLEEKIAISDKTVQTIPVGFDELAEYLATAKLHPLVKLGDLSVNKVGGSVAVKGKLEVKLLGQADFDIVLGRGNDDNLVVERGEFVSDSSRLKGRIDGISEQMDNLPGMIVRQLNESLASVTTRRVVRMMMDETGAMKVELK